MYALSNLRRRSGRTALTVTGLTLAISLMVVMFSVGNGVRDSARSLLRSSGVDIFVQANGTSLGFANGEFDQSRELAGSMISGNDKIETALPLLMFPMYGMNETMRQAILSVAPGDNSSLANITKTMKIKSMTIDGIIPNLVGKLGGVSVLEGAGFTHTNDPFYSNGTYAGGKSSPNFTKEISINKAIKKALKVGVGDVIYLNVDLPQNTQDLGTWIANATPFHVVALVQSAWEGVGSSIGYTHLSEIQFLAGKTNDTANQILVAVKDPTDANHVKDWIKKTYPQLDAFTVEDFLGEIDQVTQVFRGFGEMILLVTGVIVVMFVSTVMMISIRERTAEIAALRAIGFSKSSVFGNVLLEVFFLIMIGFIIGIICGVGLALGLDNYLINMAMSTPESSGLPAGFHFVSITPLLLGQMGLVAIGFGLLCGLIPAVWAAQLNIAQTLKKE
jgi:ABC-type lipoprotein release transport system permease subunit